MSDRYNKKRFNMSNSSMLMKMVAAVLLAAATIGNAAEPSKVFSEESAVFFGVPDNRVLAHMNVFAGGRFFSTADYGYVPGGEYKLTAKDFGVTSWLNTGDLYVRGQVPVSVKSKYGSLFVDWLSDGGKCVCGVTYDSVNPTQQVDRAVIYWGEMAPKPGSWGVCIQDADGNFQKIAVDNQKAIYPEDQTTINFPPTTVKTFYAGFKAGADGAKNNFVAVRRIDLHRFEKPLVDNRLAVWQTDAYTAGYATDRPGTVKGLMLGNWFFVNNGQLSLSRGENEGLLNNLSSFIEMNGKRHYAAKGDYPVRVEKDGRTQTLRYDLRFALPDNPEVPVSVTAVYGVSLKDTVKFEFKAPGLPEGAKLGFEMFDRASWRGRLFGSYVDRGVGALVEDIGGGKVFDTPAGPLGLKARGTDKLQVINGDPIRFDLLADKKELAVALSLPIGPLAGVQPGMANYAWYPSLAGQGDEGVAPFKMEDLELLETVNLADPNDPHEVYDISNDPLILNWKKSGEKKLPGEFGALNFVNAPESGKVPLTTILGSACRALNNKDTTYFRFNLKTARFEPQTPYLIVVEHAFDKKRFGEFHAVALDPTGLKIVENNLWHTSNPMGGCDTGEPPYAGKFKKESTFFFHHRPTRYGQTTQISLCFSTRIQWSSSNRMSDKDRPDGPAVRSVSIYRVKKMPALPDLQALAPQGGIRRHITVGTESSGSPWQLSEFPKLAGYNSIFCNHTMPSQFLFAMHNSISRPGLQDAWHAGTLESQRWLFESAAAHDVCAKIFSQSLIPLGFEGTDYNSFETRDGTMEGRFGSSAPLSPTPAEFAHLAKAFDKAISALAEYKSFNDISAVASAQSFFTRRNLDDFSRETGVVFTSSPVLLENLRNLLDSDQATVDAWTTWSCRKRFEYLDWLLKLARKHKPALYLSINQGWMQDALQAAYCGGRETVGVHFDQAKLKARGINNYYDFLKFVCHDPALYSGSDGFCFVVEKERINTEDNNYQWPSPYKQPWFEKLRDGFGGGLSIAAPMYDECPKPLKGWTCHRIKDQRSFRRDFVEGLLYANARDFFLDSYTCWPYQGQLDDLRTFAVPFQLLPFAKSEDYAGKLADSAKQAVIKKYGERYGLMNAGNLPTDVTLTLPEGAKTVIDLSNGVRQTLLTTKSPSGQAEVKIHLEPWSLKTMEIK